MMIQPLFVRKKMLRSLTLELSFGSRVRVFADIEDYLMEKKKRDGMGSFIGRRFD